MGSVRYGDWGVSEGGWEWVVCDMELGRERRRVGMGNVRY